jgi:hypothetical protein
MRQSQIRFPSSLSIHAPLIKSSGWLLDGQEEWPTLSLVFLDQRITYRLDSCLRKPTRSASEPTRASNALPKIDDFTSLTPEIEAPVNVVTDEYKYACHVVNLRSSNFLESISSQASHQPHVGVNLFKYRMLLRLSATSVTLPLKAAVFHPGAHHVGRSPAQPNHYC